MLLDREEAASHQISVRVIDTAGSSSDQQFTIALGDVDEFDVGAVTDREAATNKVSENAAIGTLVGITAMASDADATENSVSYSLADDAGGLFAIDASTGVVTVAGALDCEAGATLSITVRATSADGSSSDQQFTIALGDVDEFDVEAVADGDAAANEVSENAPIGTLVGITAVASDADATESSVSYALADDAGGLFVIDASTGVITVAGALDRKAGATLSITVRATSADGSSSDQQFTIALRDVDEPNAAPIANPDAFVVDEDSSVILAAATLVENDTDAERDALTISDLDTTATLGLVTDNGDGTFTYDPNGAFEGLGAGESALDRFFYTISDGNGGTDIGSVFIIVEGRDEEPQPNIVAGTSGRDILSGTGADDVFLFRGGYGDVGVGNGGDDTFDFTESFSNGLVDNTRISDWSEGDTISGFGYNDVHMETVRSSSTTLRFAYGPDRDVLTVTGDVSGGLEALFDTAFV